ncbi:MAG: hypothetical protein LBH38_01615 [Holosporales bacterium]|jgi:hypothetical protein|nr:hypothetical protein [Holosporales bacterium]
MSDTLSLYAERNAKLRLLDHVREKYMSKDGRAQSRTPPFLIEVPDITEGTTSGMETYLSCYGCVLEFDRLMRGEATSRVTDYGQLQAHTVDIVIEDDKHIALLFEKHTSADVIDTITINTMINLKSGVQTKRGLTLTNCQIKGIFSDGDLAIITIYYDQIDFSYTHRDRTGTDSGNVAAGFNYSTWSAAGE